SQPEDGRGNDRNPNSGSPLQQFFGIGTDGLATDLDIGGTPIKKSVSQAKGRTVLGLPFVSLPTGRSAAIFCFGRCQTGGVSLAFTLVVALSGPLGRFFWPPGPKLQKVGPCTVLRPFGLSIAQEPRGTVPGGTLGQSI